MTIVAAKNSKISIKKNSKRTSLHVKMRYTTKKMTIYKEKQSRVEMLQVLAAKTGLSKIKVENLFQESKLLMEGHLRKGGSGEIIVPFLGIKIRRIKKKASKARTMISPLTGQKVQIAAKPVRQSIKISALKPLREILENY